MMRRLELTLALGRYDINDALISGAVGPQGVDLTVLVYPSPERHRRMVRHGEFDVSELSMASYLALYGRPDPPFIAIPAFPHRRFRHGYIFVRADAGIERPDQLNGRRVGLVTWQTTAALWARGFLQDDHGVDLTSIDWLTQDEEDVPLDHVGRFRIERAPGGSSVVDLLLRGELDALIHPDIPEPVQRGDPRIRRLFPDPKRAEIEYFARTGCFPIMHTVVLKRALNDEHPWLAGELLAAFRKSKDLGIAAMRDPRRVSVAWLGDALEEQRRVLGADPWAYDLQHNRVPVETMLRYAHEQGLTPRQLGPADLFAASTLDEKLVVA